MASSTYKTFLMIKNSGVYEKLIDIKGYPDLGGEPEMLEKTTMSDGMQLFEPGVQQSGSLQFEANYDLTDYNRLKELKGAEHSYAVWFGGTGEGENLVPSGEGGKFKFDGKLSVFVVSAKVNEIRNMTISIAASTEVELDS